MESAEWSQILTDLSNGFEKVINTTFPKPLHIAGIVSLTHNDRGKKDYKANLISHTVFFYYFH